MRLYVMSSGQRLRSWCGPVRSELGRLVGDLPVRTSFGRWYENLSYQASYLSIVAWMRASEARVEAFI